MDSDNENILRHIMREEGYRERPYLDPGHGALNIGYAKSFKQLSPSQIQQVLAQPKGQRNAFALRFLTPEERAMRWDEPTARKQLWHDYGKAREGAQKWLMAEGFPVSNPRLLDQLGMLAYASKFNNFKKFASTRQALEAKDENQLSLLASRFGRTAVGADASVKRVLAARRNAERAYFLGERLPEAKGVKATGQDLTVPSPEVTGLERFKVASDVVPESVEDISASNAAILGERGTRQANELVWKMVGNKGDMPNDFDAVEWAGGVLSEEGPTFEDATSSGTSDWWKTQDTPDPMEYLGKFVTKDVTSKPLSAFTYRQ